ncbi:alpha/beta hydrolase-fold protein [Prolixibacteraceae bacterium Z1-6]|uniref:Alpha/beta hydrolase-fold protein n=1 Tax=Draconibacterium aestuarii TaxID=2998507 RepID=A0A9X3F8D6_9BACT|nr:alpha/beta hydrolase-fold protein [Prolixibacteraceae bacterium Z1-6]
MGNRKVIRIQIGNKLIWQLTLLFLLGTAIHSQAQQEAGVFSKLLFVDNGDTLKYQILYPENYNPDEKYPLLLFLHGAGERGDDNKRQMNMGGNLFTKEQSLKDHPAIVVFPQCPVDTMWTARIKHKNEAGEWVFEFSVKEKAPRPAEMVNQLVESLIETPQADQQRVYILGISMGGIGTLEFLHRWPDKYAAAAVICGGHDPELTKNYRHIPIWFFHRRKDDVVPSHYSKEIYDKVKIGNKSTKYTLYPEANHNSWDAALAEPELLNWIFKFKK